MPVFKIIWHVAAINVKNLLQLYIAHSHRCSHAGFQVFWNVAGIMALKLESDMKERFVAQLEDLRICDLLR